MSMWKKLAIFGTTALTLAACGNGSEGTNETTESAEDADYKIAMITDIGGVDDRSFNQSSWEGMQAWAEENDFSEDAIQYYPSNSESDFIPNLNTAVMDGYDIICGIGFLLEDAITTSAQQHPDQYFALVDGEIDLPNVASLNFRDHENSFLAGMAAALTTETGRVGFIGGVEGPVIDRFQTGFTHGVEHVDDSIEVDVQYANSFGDTGAGQQIAAAMYSNGADVIFHAAGAVGNGVFKEARNRMEDGSDTQLWVIGVDRDQEAEGEYDGGNVTLASTIKQVGNAVRNLTNQTMNEGFPGNETLYYGFAEEGIDFTRGQIADEDWALIEEARQQIIDGELEVREFTYTETE
ncbi:MAG TPA: BMP family protein [Atopostipes sp.]|nr:BMP family protein [Atopostipes sp.]